MKLFNPEFNFKAPSTDVLAWLWGKFSPLTGWLISFEFLLLAPYYHSYSAFWVGMCAAVPACYILGYLLKNRLSTHLPFVLVYIVFLIGNYAKLALFTFYSVTGKEQQLVVFLAASRLDLFQMAMEPANVAKATAICGIGILGLALALIGMLLLPKKKLILPQPPQPKWTPSANTYLVRLMAIGIVMLVTTNYLAHRYDFGFMGREQTRLPFKLTGIINYLRTFPEWMFISVSLFGVYLRRIRFVLLGLGGMVCVVLGVSLFAGGRGSFTIVMMYIFMFAAIYRIFSLKHLIICLVLFFASSLLRPLFENYRQIVAVSDAQFNAATAVVEALRGLPNETASLADTLVARASTIAFRIIGLDSVIYFSIQDIPDFSLRRVYEVFAGQAHVGRILTDDYMGSTSGETHTAAPSLIGACYFMGGLLGAFGGVALFAAAMQFAYDYALQLRWWNKGLVLVKIGMITFSNASEGNFVTFLQDNIVWVGFIVLLEWQARRSLQFDGRPRQITPPRSPHNFMVKR